MKWQYEHAFITKNNEWNTAELGLNQFKPVYRGSYVEEAPPLDPKNIMRYGFLISDKQHGPFRLEIEKIVAVELSSGKPTLKMAAESTQTKGKSLP